MEKIVIIGNGISGVTFARFMRKLGYQEQLIIISSETKHFFSRTALMYIYMGHMEYKHTKPYEDFFWSKNNIELVYDHVKKVNTQDKSLKLESGEAINYDKLVIATGSKPNFFGWPGEKYNGIQGLYSYQDLQKMEKNTEGIKKAVIIGGGLIGVEMAEMLRTRDIEVTFLVREGHFWGNVLPREEAEMIADHMRKHHINLHFNAQASECKSKDGKRVSSVLTTEGEEFEADFVGITAGVSPNIDFLKESNIETDKGVLIDEKFQTSVNDIYSIGDCVQHRNPPAGRKSIEQVWYTGRIMGETLAQILTGKDVRYNPGPWFNSAKFFDIEFQTYGTIDVEKQENENRFFWKHPKNNVAIHLAFDKNTGRFIGINNFGIRLRHEFFDKKLKMKAHISEVMSDLNEATFDPEFFRSYEDEIISEFKNSYPEIEVKNQHKPWYKKIFA
ncbi:FAD/NAD(P)-binding oxidoreductase [Mangrovivirga sp. M17]|uniref:FAD/NAD(P)-binding oxidoreductase n=1 Tax=Mangrovivirga halotolerans TaxID=2993936 RepID=A0ABT3RU31_9BACT|nr:FAD/NAD(P)-binding oxidoreductase [Mangrovivirga halotolerans]MCX2745113.1 FAD/NAD(P)-binding oxidoreductase [Mangrovivirga halotolerans]